MSKSIHKGFPRAIFFDLDGTLVDSAPDLTDALNKTLRKLDLPLKSIKQVKQWIGQGVDKLIHRAITNSMDKEASGDDFWRARNIFFHYYRSQIGQHSRPYPGVEEYLNRLLDRGIAIVCITNKNRRFTIPLLSNLGLTRYFDYVLCGDDLRNKKPHPEPLLYAAKKLAVSPDCCLMIGDSISDVKAANAAKMDVICVDYGYSQGVDLSKLAIEAMVSNISEIESFVNHCSLKQCG